MRQNPHVRICGGPGSATTLVYPTEMTDDALREELTRQSRLLAVGGPISAAPPLNEAERNAP